MPSESPPPAVALVREGSAREEAILARVKREKAGAWEEFLDVFAPVLFRVASLFADNYDDRMDFFLHICDRLREHDMKRVRAFERREDAPCRFSTFLIVIAKNMAVDFLRAKEGRYRPFGRWHRWMRRISFSSSITSGTDIPWRRRAAFFKVAMGFG